KIAISTDVAAPSFSFTKNTNADNIAGGLVAYSGIDSSNPFDVTPATVYDNIASDNTLNANAITTVNSNSAIIMFGAYNNDYTVNGWNMSLTELYDVPDNTSNQDIGLAAAWVT